MSEQVKRSFNLPKSLHDRIERIARREDRTVNSQVVRWLEQKVREYEAQEKAGESGQFLPALMAA